MRTIPALVLLAAISIISLISLIFLSGMAPASSASPASESLEDGEMGEGTSVDDSYSSSSGKVPAEIVPVEIIFIESPGCTKCAAAKRTLDKVGQDVPINISAYYYYTDEGHRIIKEYHAGDVPAVIIGEQVVNYRDYDGDLDRMEALVRGALANYSPPQAAAVTLPGKRGPVLLAGEQGSEPEGDQADDQASEKAGVKDLNLEEFSLYAVSAVLGAGLVAGFNPCLLGILVFLAASVLSSSGRRRELLTMVVFFSLGIFAMYFLFGLGMQRALQTEAVAASFRYILTGFLVIAGLSQVWDAVRLHRGRPSLFRTDWALKYFQAGLDRGRYSSYFLIGALFSLVKAPCVGAIYLAILDLLSAKSYLEGATYLLFFNLGVILPILVLGGAIALGMSPEQVDSFRKDHRVGMRLFTGLALIALAPLIYWQII
ncbi:MAG TPA: cytochrome c biogenesis protein [Methanothrix sp.]|nr:cytochrome c biogenesis protein [Methanothrix sp.]